ncbi:DsbA family protein [Pseudomonas sp. 21LCFQ010]|uniref:DsbA family oxidoreductase n=1 Tax=Pseudomonas sp. 21LCFQ010 TaxID=2957506 RepID=UPI002096F68B|nr:DsbA family protein [Pseudomonas sp. 21LCFQ010]MCO8166135.1 DsbA family protein [Pseudomonas sp. 21LCFQ010]
MHTDTQPALRVDIWSDYVCPFCYLQLPVLEQLQARYGAMIEWRWHAFELRPEPLTTPDPQADYLRMTWLQAVLPMADRRQLTMKIPPVQPHSRKALEAANFARSQGRFGDFNRALFRAFFEYGQNIGEDQVLLQLASATGLKPEALRLALQEQQHRVAVSDDEALADTLGLRAVPVLLLRRASQPLSEAQVLNGTLPLQRLTQEIDALLA